MSGSILLKLYFIVMLEKRKNNDSTVHPITVKNRDEDVIQSSPRPKTGKVVRIRKKELLKLRLI